MDSGWWDLEPMEMPAVQNARCLCEWWHVWMNDWILLLQSMQPTYVLTTSITMFRFPAPHRVSYIQAATMQWPSFPKLACVSLEVHIFCDRRHRQQPDLIPELQHPHFRAIGASASGRIRRWVVSGWVFSGRCRGRGGRLRVALVLPLILSKLHPSAKH